MKGLLLTVLCVALTGAAVVKNDYPSQASAICAAEKSEGLLVAHENCNKFYKCNFGLPVAMICPSSLLYEPSTEICNWASAVECGDRIISEENENIPGDQWTGNGNGNSDPSQANPICAAEGSDHIYVAHENCNQFYQCWAGKPVALLCPYGLLFNPDKDYCDFPYNVVCDGRVIPVDQENNNGNGNGNNDYNVEDDVPNGNNNNDPSQASAICKVDESEGILVAHENCNQFYKCNFGKPEALVCPGNLLFDPTKDRCEWANTVDCGDRTIPEQTENAPGGNEWNGNGAGNNDPSQANRICAAENSDHSYVAHEDCNKFYQCWAGLPVALPCPEGFLFNPDKDYCDFPYNVDCGTRIH